MKERPILFSTPMVQAILDGRKTMTRRMNGLETASRFYNCVNGKPRPLYDNVYSVVSEIGDPKEIKCPYGKKGDVLWVRETWLEQKEFKGEYLFKATCSPDTDKLRRALNEKWKPSIHMPKSASRIWLEITDIRVERLQDITENDARAEGVNYVIDKITGYCGYDYESGGYNLMTTSYHGFRSLWRSINGTDSWQKNPWVWVVSFKVLSTTGKPDLSTHQLTNSTL